MGNEEWHEKSVEDFTGSLDEQFENWEANGGGKIYLPSRKRYNHKNQKYRCEICGVFHNSAIMAKKCESMHYDSLNDNTKHYPVRLNEKSNTQQREQKYASLLLDERRSCPICGKRYNTLKEASKCATLHYGKPKYNESSWVVYCGAIFVICLVCIIFYSVGWNLASAGVMVLGVMCILSKAASDDVYKNTKLQNETNSAIMARS